MGGGLAFEGGIPIILVGEGAGGFEMADDGLEGAELGGELGPLGCGVEGGGAG